MARSEIRSGLLYFWLDCSRKRVLYWGPGVEAPIYGVFVKPLSLVRARPKAALLLLLLVLPFFPNPGQSASVLQLAVQKPNEMKIDSIAAAPGQFVSVAISITNAAPVVLLNMQMRYDPLFLSFQNATRALRVADWIFFESVGTPNPDEIRIEGIANPTLPMQPGSGPVGYLNFQVIDQPVPPGLFIPISFIFRDSTDNTMYDSAGNWIDTSQIDYDSGGISVITTGLADQGKNRPDGFELGQNYPNPFNPYTSFTLTMPKSGRYLVRIYNLAGQAVKSFEGEAPAGTQRFTWNGTDQNGAPVSSGIYLYKASMEGYSETRKMILIR